MKRPHASRAAAGKDGDMGMITGSDILAKSLRAQGVQSRDLDTLREDGVI